jgi:hypothetical protein
MPSGPLLRCSTIAKHMHPHMHAFSMHMREQRGIHTANLLRGQHRCLAKQQSWGNCPMKLAAVKNDTRHKLRVSRHACEHHDRLETHASTMQHVQTARLAILSECVLWMPPMWTTAQPAREYIGAAGCKAPHKPVHNQHTLRRLPTVCTANNAAAVHTYHQVHCGTFQALPSTCSHTCTPPARR